MNTEDYTITARKRGQHLTMFSRGAIKALKAQNLSNREIAKRLNCSPTTVGNELKRGTPERKGKCGRYPSYSPELAQKRYEENRLRCRRHYRILSCTAFAAWVIDQCLSLGRSIDSCVGEARQRKLFRADDMVCTKTLYNAVWNNMLTIKAIDLPEAVSRRKRSNSRNRKNKRIFGRSITERPEIISERKEFGHWEIDTVRGRRRGAALLTLVEKKSHMLLTAKLPDGTSESVLAALLKLYNCYGSNFSRVFKSITSDNGSEFSNLSGLEEVGTKIYFARPYTSTDRAQNERMNREIRRSIPKGTAIEDYTEEYIRDVQNRLNGTPRRSLGFSSAEEKFRAFFAA